MLTTIASSAVRSENSTPGQRSFLQSHRGALMGAFSRPASHRVGPTIVLSLAYLFAPGRYPASVTTGGTQSLEEPSREATRKALRRTVLPAAMRQDEREATYSCFGLPPATTYIVRGNRGTLVLPDVPCRS